MAKKKYTFIVEKVYRAEVEGEFDLDELRKINTYKYLTDEEILISLAQCEGMFNEKQNDYNLEEENVRSIWSADEIIYED